jgi:hypothetical protein
MANGTFTSSAILRAQLKGEQMFAAGDPQVRHLMMNDFGVAKALLESQLANVEPLQRSANGKDQNVTIHWMEHVPQALADPCAADCEFTGDESGTYSENKDLTDCVEYTFSIDESKFHNSYFDPIDSLAKQFLVADHVLANDLNAKALAFLDANIGISEYDLPSQTSNLAAGITIPAASFNSALFAQLQTAVKLNRFNAPFMVGGISMSEQVFLQQTDTTEGAAGRLQRWGTMPLFFDTDADGLGGDSDNASFIVNAGSYAVAIRNTAPETPMEMGFEGRRKYSIPSRFIDGVRWDVFERKVCSNAGEDVTTHFLVKARVGFFLAPQYTQKDGGVGEPTNTGILKLLQG